MATHSCSGVVAGRARRREGTLLHRTRGNNGAEFEKEPQITGLLAFGDLETSVYYYIQ